MDQTIATDIKPLSSYLGTGRQRETSPGVQAGQEQPSMIDHGTSIDFVIVL